MRTNYMGLLIAIATVGTALILSALALWPSWVGAVAALCWPVLLLALLWQIVTSGHQPLPKPVRDAAATVDGTPVKEVTVLR